MRSLISRSDVATRDESTGITVCRSSRCLGLNASKAFSALRAHSTSSSDQSGVSKTVEEATVTYKTFLDAFGEILFSLVAAPAVSSRAKEILDVHSAAKEELAELARTEKGAARISEMQAEVDGDAEAAPVVRELKSIFARWGLGGRKCRWCGRYWALEGRVCSRSERGESEMSIVQEGEHRAKQERAAEQRREEEARKQDQEGYCEPSDETRKDHAWKAETVNRGQRRATCRKTRVERCGGR